MKTLRRKGFFTKVVADAKQGLLGQANVYNRHSPEATNKYSRDDFSTESPLIAHNPNITQDLNEDYTISGKHRSVIAGISQKPEKTCQIPLSDKAWQKPIRNLKPSKRSKGGSKAPASIHAGIPSQNRTGEESLSSAVSEPNKDFIRKDIHSRENTKKTHTGQTQTPVYRKPDSQPQMDTIPLRMGPTKNRLHNKDVNPRKRNNQNENKKRPKEISEFKKEREIYGETPRKQETNLVETGNKPVQEANDALRLEKPLKSQNQNQWHRVMMQDLQRHIHAFPGEPETNVNKIVYEGSENDQLKPSPLISDKGDAASVKDQPYEKDDADTPSKPPSKGHCHTTKKQAKQPPDTGFCVEVAQQATQPNRLDSWVEESPLKESHKQNEPHKQKVDTSAQNGATVHIGQIDIIVQTTPNKAEIPSSRANGRSEDFSSRFYIRRV